jgi:NitT/TauT family transport system permease protein
MSAAASSRTVPRKAGSTVPVLVITAMIMAAWYAACLPMNNDLPQLARVTGLAERYKVSWAIERPVLPAPHQCPALHSPVQTEVFKPLVAP